MTLGVKPKPRLSGAARRKIAREKKAVAERHAAPANKIAKPGDLLPADYTGAPTTYDEWRREGREVYWDMKRRRIAMDDGRTLVWAGEINARLAKMAEELAYLKDLNEKLQAVSAQQSGGFRHSQEVFPSNMDQGD